jgi:hypothetical protein
VKIEEPTLALGESADIDGALRFDAHTLKDGRCATGKMISLPESSNPMKPRSNRWSMLGVSRSPFSPSTRSSFDESRHGLQ